METPGEEEEQQLTHTPFQQQMNFGSYRVLILYNWVSRRGVGLDMNWSWRRQAGGNMPLPRNRPIERKKSEREGKGGGSSTQGGTLQAYIEKPWLCYAPAHSKAFSYQPVTYP